MDKTINMLDTNEEVIDFAGDLLEKIKINIEVLNGAFNRLNVKGVSMEDLEPAYKLLQQLYDLKGRVFGKRDMLRHNGLNPKDIVRRDYYDAIKGAADELKEITPAIVSAVMRLHEIEPDQQQPVWDPNMPMTRLDSKIMFRRISHIIETKNLDALVPQYVLIERVLEEYTKDTDVINNYDRDLVLALLKLTENVAELYDHTQQKAKEEQSNHDENLLFTTYMRVVSDIFEEAFKIRKTDDAKEALTIVKGKLSDVIDEINTLPDLTEEERKNLRAYIADQTEIFTKEFKRSYKSLTDREQRRK